MRVSSFPRHLLWAGHPGLTPTYEVAGEGARVQHSGRWAQAGLLPMLPACLRLERAGGLAKGRSHVACQKGPGCLLESGFHLWLGEQAPPRGERMRPAGDPGGWAPEQGLRVRLGWKDQVYGAAPPPTGHGMVKSIPPWPHASPLRMVGGYFPELSM